MGLRHWCLVVFCLSSHNILKKAIFLIFSVIGLDFSSVIIPRFRQKEWPMNTDKIVFRGKPITPGRAERSRGC